VKPISRRLLLLAVPTFLVLLLAVMFAKVPVHPVAWLA
jgi:hypothetical protein